MHQRPLEFYAFSLLSHVYNPTPNINGVYRPESPQMYNRYAGWTGRCTSLIRLPAAGLLCRGEPFWTLAKPKFFPPLAKTRSPQNKYLN